MKTTEQRGGGFDLLEFLSESWTVAYFLDEFYDKFYTAETFPTLKIVDNATTTPPQQQVEQPQEQQEQEDTKQALEQIIQDFIKKAENAGQTDIEGENEKDDVFAASNEEKDNINVTNKRTQDRMRQLYKDLQKEGTLLKDTTGGGGGEGDNRKTLLLQKLTKNTQQKFFSYLQNCREILQIFHYLKK